jgi:hypothetical protein
MPFKRLLRLCLVLLFLVAIFDPANKITDLKLPLFVAVWGLFILYAAASERVKVSKMLLILTLAFSFLLPLSSIALYMASGGDPVNFDGFRYLQSYLFFTIVIVLNAIDFDLVPVLARALTVMSVLIIGVAVIIFIAPASNLTLYALWDEYGVLAPGERTYGGVSFTTNYFVTSPLLALSVGFYSYRLIGTRGLTRTGNLVCLGLNMAGMFLGGTRNNILFSLLIPLLVFVWSARRRVLAAGIAAALLFGSAVLNANIIADMFSRDDESNFGKLLHLNDYLDLLAHPGRLLFGYGLGSHFFSAYVQDYVSITELTYFEVIRNFGLIVAIPYYVFLLAPLYVLLLRDAKEHHYLYISYACYLAMCATNPFLVSSSGMLLLSVVWYRTTKILSAWARRPLPTNVRVRQIAAGNA